MLVFKTFIVVILIFTPKIIETKLPYNTYEVGILGTPLCRKITTGFVVVYLSEKPHIQKESKPIARTVIEYGYQFVLTRKVRSFKKPPKLYVKIFFSCTKKKYIREKMYIQQIPSDYIRPSGEYNHYFNLGYIEMSSQKSVNVSNSRRKSFWL